MFRSIHPFLLIYIWQKADCKKQTPRIKFIIVLICRFKATDMHIAKSMDKLFIS